MIFAFISLAVFVGCLMPLQAGLNAQLTRQLGQPYLGAFISFFVGTILLLVLSLINGGFGDMRRFGAVPPHLFLGGVLGAIFVGSSIFFIPKMGATAMIACFIAGQLLSSVLIDHWGLLGLTQHPINGTRIFGIILLFVGLLLVIKKDA